jgi:hypothetical protein
VVWPLAVVGRAEARRMNVQVGRGRCGVRGVAVRRQRLFESDVCTRIVKKQISRLHHADHNT